MNVPDKIWQDESLDTLDKLILGIIANGGEYRDPADIAQELGTTQTRVTRKIHRMSKEGRLSIIITQGKTRMEVHHG